VTWSCWEHWFRRWWRQRWLSLLLVPVFVSCTRTSRGVAVQVIRMLNGSETSTSDIKSGLCFAPRLHLDFDATNLRLKQGILSPNELIVAYLKTKMKNTQMGWRQLRESKINHGIVMWGPLTAQDIISKIQRMPTMKNNFTYKLYLKETFARESSYSVISIAIRLQTHDCRFCAVFGGKPCASLVLDQFPCRLDEKEQIESKKDCNCRVWILPENFAVHEADVNSVLRHFYFRVLVIPVICARKARESTRFKWKLNEFERRLAYK